MIIGVSFRFWLKSKVKISVILFSFNFSSEDNLLLISILLSDAFSLKPPASKIKSETDRFSEYGKTPGLFISPEIST